MPITKGEQWGHPGDLPPGAPVATSDAEAAALVVEGATTVPTIGIEGGDLARTLGIRTPYRRDTPKQLLPIDALAVELDDGTRHIALAHVLAGNLRLGGAPVALMNAAFVGPRNIAPRAHPGDGKADIVRMELDLGDRIQAWKRMRTGTHVPHPQITIRQRSDGVVELPRPQRIRVDGHRVGTSTTLRFHVIAGAIVVAAS